MSKNRLDAEWGKHLCIFISLIVHLGIHMNSDKQLLRFDFKLMFMLSWMKRWIFNLANLTMVENKQLINNQYYTFMNNRGVSSSTAY